MEFAFYAVVYLGVAALDLLVAYQARLKNTEASNMLANCLSWAAVVGILYLVSISFNHPAVAITANTLCVACMDIMLIYLLSFIYALMYGKLRSNKMATLGVRALMVLAVCDMVSVVINPLFGHVASYEYLGPDALPHFRFMAHPAYFIHLAFCYVVIAYSFIALFRHVFKIPRMYRIPYYRIFAGTLIVVLLNALYLLYLASDSADLTIVTYGIWGFAIYLAAFVWGNRNVLENACFNTIMASSQPTIIFDYKGGLFHSNAAARALFPELASTDEAMVAKITYESFIKNLHLDSLPHFNDGQTRFYWTPDEPGAFSYICDYQEIKDNHGECVARSLVFTNNTLSVDPLTSYLTEQYFVAHNQEFAELDRHPVAVAVCDLNQLGLLNNVAGVKRGDDAIRLQADLIRKYLPEHVIFVRLHDARLAALCYGFTQDEIKTQLALANADLGEAEDFNMRLRMDYAVAMLEETDDDVVSAAGRAVSILKTRKILDRGSGHSSTLDSLNQMLAECDGETEGHVQRTRILGDSLAFELGLSDYERDQLSLLCLYHDIGKVGIPTNILQKPASLTEAEKEVMREHVQKGYRIACATPGLEIVAEPILHHHERWDGEGYPNGLQHEAIPILSRVISVIDSYDAMVSDRPYHKGISSAAACAELKRCAGKQFDPYIVDAFVRTLNNKNVSDELRAASTGEETELRQARGAAISGVAEAAPSSQTAMMSAVAYTRYCVDAEQHIYNTDEAFERLTGYTEYDVKELKLTQDDLLFDEDREQYWELVRAEITEHNMAYLEHRLRRKDGTGCYVYCTGVLMGEGADAYTEIIVTDITDANSVQRQVNLARNRAMMSLRRLEETVRLDPMTKLLNRAAFINACSRALLETDQHCALIMIDIDDFKHYNDTYGHPRGDVLLQEFAAALQKAAGEEDLLGRMGGDEFACLLVFKNTASIGEIRERVTSFWSSVKGHFFDELETPSFSMGVAYLELGDTDFEKLYNLADVQLYSAKNSGKNRFSW